MPYCIMDEGGMGWRIMAGWWGDIPWPGPIMARGHSPGVRWWDMFSPSGPTLTLGGRWPLMMALVYMGPVLGGLLDPDVLDTWLVASGGACIIGGDWCCWGGKLAGIDTLGPPVAGDMRLCCPCII